MNLSKKIQQLRVDKGLSQAELASRINRSRQFIVNIETHKTSPSINDVTEIGTALGVKLEDIIIVGDSASSPPVTRIDALINEPSREKFKQVLLYVLSIVGAKPNIGETALYKLLYFIDFHYYKYNGESITGASYIRNHFGPTPIQFKAVIDEMIKDKQVIRVISKFFQYEQKKYIPLDQPDLSNLSAKEKQHIDNIVSYYGDKSASELSSISHGETPWRETAQGAVIDYKLIKK